MRYIVHVGGVDIDSFDRKVDARMAFVKHFTDFMIERLEKRDDPWVEMCIGYVAELQLALIDSDLVKYREICERMADAHIRTEEI